MDIKMIIVGIISAVIASIATIFVIGQGPIINQENIINSEASIPDPNPSSIIMNIQGTTSSVIQDCNSNPMSNIEIRLVDPSAIGNIINTDINGEFSFTSNGGIYQISFPEYPNINAVQFVVVSGESVRIPAYRIDPVNQMWCN